ncbi:response regulator [Ammoniphilus sp. 3BR4]|uniref:response regulator n=1 Tax=Ammoniphilus sp. 3BR4 TaxID=3158265 RepID=UPI003465BE2F
MIYEEENQAAGQKGIAQGTIHPILLGDLWLIFCNNLGFDFGGTTHFIRKGRKGEYKELSPDLVLMDIFMPELDGITALKEIKKLDPMAKVIFCTAVSDRSKIRYYSDSGRSDRLLGQADPTRNAII